MRISKKAKSKLLLALTLCILLLNYSTNKLGQNKNNLQVQQTNNVISAGFYKVVKFEDGDTITVDMAGNKETIRMIGVDTPEVKDPRKPVQCFGKNASNFTKMLIGDNPVKLEADPINTNRDRYNRLLRYVYLPSGELVNAEIIKQGYGFAYTSFPFTKVDEFKNYQDQARNQNKGLWSSCQPVTNQYGGMTSNPE